MRQKYIWLMMGMCCISALRSQSNSLVVFSASGEPFLLTVDQQAVNTTPQSNVKAFGLSTGRHTIGIQVPASKRVLNDSLLFADVPKYRNKEFTYALLPSGKTLVLHFISVSEPSGPASPAVPEAPKEAAPIIDNSTYGKLYQVKNNKAVFFQNYSAGTASCQAALDGRDIAYALKLLQSVNDEDRRMSYARSIVLNNCYTVDQLRQLLLVFPAEMDRLALAKPAYTHLSDRANFAQLYPAFRYQSIKDGYTAFVQDQEILLSQKNMSCLQAIDHTAFAQLQSNIKNAGYDSDRLALAKKSLGKLCLSSEQALQLALLFGHDREKLECMKYAYHVLVDKENAAKLASQFQFTETKQDFLKYISN